MIIEKKNHVVEKKEKKIKELCDEIERRKFIEAKVQKYVKGIITQNEKCKDLLKSIAKNTGGSNGKEINKINEFLNDIESKEFDENEGESTENENNDDEEESIDEQNQ